MTQQSQTQNILDDSSIFRIMIASDNHLGYLENDEIRGDDSFNSFEEILKLCKTENVDFLLLGGDLFHHHNPSKKTIIRTSNILQKYVYGQRLHKYEVFCYDPNFKNENLSVEIPIFTIHGNHDYPSGFENFSSIDIFSNKEVNYFGKVNNYEEFDLFPILFVKGETKIALYGIGSIKDERLYLALQNKKVNFHRPNDFKKWFNILVVHQNRFKGHNIGKNKKNYLPESLIPNFFDLVIWGHEHECFTEPVYNNEVGFYVYQPGSSVATSLIQAEAKSKCIGICEINGNKFWIDPIKLETVRPFIYNQYELRAYADKIKTQEDIERIIDEKIEEALKEVEIVRKTDPKNMNDLLPIIRLKIEYSGYQMTRTNFIVSKYSGKIANLNDVIQFWKKSELFTTKTKFNKEDVDMDDLHDGNLSDEMQETDDELRQFIEENISNYYVEKNIKNFLNTDIFCDYLDREVNGNERHSLQLLFQKFNEASISLSANSTALKETNPLEIAKKDCSDLFESIVNKTDLNNILINGDNNNNNFANLKNGNKNKKNNSLGNILPKGMMHLEMENNFMNEKRINKNDKNVSQTVNQMMTNNNNNNNILDGVSDQTVRNKKPNNMLEFFNVQPSIDSNERMNSSENEMDEDFSSGNILKKYKTTGGPGRKKIQYKIEPKKPNKRKK